MTARRDRERQAAVATLFQAYTDQLTELHRTHAVAHEPCSQQYIAAATALYRAFVDRLAPLEPEYVKRLVAASRSLHRNGA